MGPQSHGMIELPHEVIGLGNLDRMMSYLRCSTWKALFTAAGILVSLDIPSWSLECLVKRSALNALLKSEFINV